MASLTTKGSADEHQLHTAPVGRGGKISRHCRQRWWVWLIAFCLFVLVIVLIVIYAIFPAVAQKQLNKTYLTVHSLEILDPAPDSFSLSINSTISGASGIASHAHLDPMEVSFYTPNSEEAFMTLPLPGINGGDDIPIIVSNVTTKISDLRAFSGFAGLLLGSENLSFEIKGRTTIHVGKLHTGIDYNEVVVLKGFNKLTGMQIKSYNLISNDPNANLGGKVLIPNPTVVTVDMGTVHISFSLNGNALGLGTIPNLVISPGNHEYDFRGRLSEQALKALLGAVVAGKGTTALTVKGNGTEANGVDIPWLTAPLGSLEVNVPIAV